MEIITQTDYQDVYRIAEGVLFVVNKFIPIKYENRDFLVLYGHKETKSYSKGCQDSLKVLKADYTTSDRIFIPKGTVLYINRPVINTDNTEDWTYEIRSSGGIISGHIENVEKILNDVLHIMKARTT